MRTIIGVVFLVAVASANAVGTSPQLVDLNRPGTLEQLKQQRPKHYEAITAVLRVVERVPCKDRQVETLKVRFDIREMACNFVLMTSNPPQRRLSFSLEGTNYVAVVTLKDTEGRAIPAKNAD